MATGCSWQCLLLKEGLKVIDRPAAELETRSDTGHAKTFGAGPCAIKCLQLCSPAVSWVTGSHEGVGVLLDPFPSLDQAIRQPCPAVRQLCKPISDTMPGRAPFQAYPDHGFSPKVPLPSFSKTRPRLGRPKTGLARAGPVYTLSVRGEQAHHQPSTAKSRRQII